VTDATPTDQPVRWPPRSELPRGIIVTRLPFLGTTWYDRGVRYWLRRAVLTAVMATGVAVATAILSGVLHAARQSSQTAFWVVVAVEAVISVISLGVIFARSRRMGTARGTAALRKTLAPSRRTRGLGAGAGLLVRTGSLLAQAFVVVSALAFYGTYIALLLLSLLPRLDIERQARYELAQQLRWYPVGQGGRQPDRERPQRRHPGRKHHPSHHHR
jgi:hypothetical protein